MLIDQLKSLPPAVQALLVAATLLPLYYGSYWYRALHPYGASNSAEPATSLPIDFVREWLEVEVVDPFDPYPIASYCNRTTWHPNLVFSLATANGGIGNIRGNFLDFLLYALEAGASIMLPSMASRASDNLGNVWAPHIPFDTFFDEEWFIYSMGQACPQMAIYRPEKNMTVPEGLSGLYGPSSRRMDVDQANTKEKYLGHLDQWLKNHKEYQPSELTLVNHERTLFEIDLRSLPPGMRRNFGLMLRINPTIRRLAAIVVQNLKAKFRLRLHPWDAIPHKAFYGCHLRTEADAALAGWLNGDHANFTAQTDAHIALALDHKLDVIYVASGDANHTDLFAAKAAAHRPTLNVTTKLDLLPVSEIAALQQLSWDQQALVDFEVLKRCSFFGGLVKSSFSYNIALTRNQWLEDHGRVTDPWLVLDREDGVAFDDGISRVLGRDEFHEHRIPRGMWP